MGDDRTGRVWIQGDLHAENFGTYMDGTGVLVFDVNDFDEACLGHVTWDLQRMGASVALLGWTKALSDDDITRWCRPTCAPTSTRSASSCPASRTTGGRWAWTTPPARSVPPCATPSCRRGSRCSTASPSCRTPSAAFRAGEDVRRLDDEERAVVERAYAAYLDTVPDSKRLEASAARSRTS